MTKVSVALVTGGAGSLGMAIGKRLASQGKKVVLVDLDGNAVDAAVESLRNEGIDVFGAVADVTKSDEIDHTVSKVEAEIGPVDVLVNNAGFTRDASLVKMSDEDFRSVLDVCLFGTFVCSRAVAPGMIERNHGKIVNISSRAHHGNPGQVNYSAAKAGVIGMTKALAKELGRFSVTVNAVAPGLIDTPAVQEHRRYDLLVEMAEKQNSIRRIGVPEDVAAMVAFLSSDDSSFITGEVMHVSGGRYS